MLHGVVDGSSASGVRVRVLRRVVAGLVPVLLVAMVDSGQALAVGGAGIAAPSASSAKASRTGVASRPDEVSARVAARAQGSRVEVEDLRTETSTTWVNPNGSLTTEQHQAPIRFRDAKGAWQDVNLSLAAASDGSVSPRRDVHDLRLGRASAAKESDLVAVGAGRDGEGKDRALRVMWAGSLPALLTDQWA